MTQIRKPTPHIDLGKAALYAIVVNAMEIVVLVAFVLYVLLVDPTRAGSRQVLQWLAVISAATAGWGALLDIRQGLLARKRARTIVELEQTNTLMDSLNHTLRAQRHDFLNHLQVVYSLLEMGEATEATEYLEKVYGEIRAVSSVLRTKSTAVNALLQVKTAACQDQGIALEVDIRTSLEGLGLPAWEMCCVLSNLLDNAMDAARQGESPRVALAMTENLREFVFRVENNGPAIPPQLLPSIFEAGVSTKGADRGMGLSIVRKTLEDAGGQVNCQSGESGTVFLVSVPKGTGP